MRDEALDAVERVMREHPHTTAWEVLEVDGGIARRVSAWTVFFPARDLRRQHPPDGVGRIIVTPAEPPA